MAKGALSGLSDAQVAARKKDGRVNITKQGKQRTVGSIVRAHTLTYFNILNLILAGLIIATGQFKNVLFIGVVICNSVIGIAQELRVKQLIDKLEVVTSTKAKILRNGKISEYPVEEIVVDDIIRILPGDQIATDGRVISSDGLELNESMLTGEARPVKKVAGDPILSGSFVVAGTGAYEVQKVGDETYAATIVGKAQKKKRATSEMQQTIGSIIKVVSILIIPLGLLLARSQYVSSGGDFATTVVRTVSGVIGMIPEGLVLLTSVSFILGVGRLAQKNALVQEMEAIEALARTSVLCTDKTGTITTGDLSVQDVIPLASLGIDQIRDIMSEIGGAFDDKNPTQNALDAYFGVDEGWKVREKIPFSSARKYRAVGFVSRGDYVLGAPEYLVPHNTKLLDLLSRYTEEGYRVLLLGRSDRISAEEEIIGRVVPVAIIVLLDVIKTDARDTFAYFADNHVALKVISGDHPVAVSAIAKKAGVVGYDKYIDAGTLPEDPDAFRKAIEGYNIFGRVKPEQKLQFVHAWQSEGETVAMVGDGVNDVLAISEADCGIAMAAGSDAARNGAHIVLMDSNFTSMQSIVREGRQVIANIERVSSLYLTKTIYSVILVFVYILLRREYPFTTLQMGLINIACIGMPSFLLTLEQNEKVARGGFLKHVLKVAAPGALTMATVILIIQLLREIFDWSGTIYSTFTLVLGGFVGLLIVAQVCSPMNRYRKLILGACIAVMVAAILFLPGFYDIHGIFMWWSLLFFPLALLAAMLVYWYSRLTNRFVSWFFRE